MNPKSASWPCCTIGYIKLTHHLAGLLLLRQWSSLEGQILHNRLGRNTVSIVAAGVEGTDFCYCMVWKFGDKFLFCWMLPLLAKSINKYFQTPDGSDVYIIYHLVFQLIPSSKTNLHETRLQMHSPCRWSSINPKSECCSAWRMHLICWMNVTPSNQLPHPRVVRPIT